MMLRAFAKWANQTRTDFRMIYGHGLILLRLLEELMRWFAIRWIGSS
jgi:hypothetical protein